MAREYVRTAEGKYLVQIPDDNQWGFSLVDDEQGWAGGFGIATEWEIVPTEEVPANVQETLGWILEE